jgi:hypothetical protein
LEPTLMLGGWVSKTVILKPTAAPPLAVQLIAVGPSAKKDPDGGLQVTVPQVLPIAGV